MNLIEFIKAKTSCGGVMQNLVNDIIGDLNLPINRSENDVIEYLHRVTDSNSNMQRALEQLLEEYEAYLASSPIDDKIEDNLDAKFSKMKTENWEYYKQNFSIDEVYLIGNPSDIYKVYCSNLRSRKSLYFDLKSDSNLNEIVLVENESIFIGNATTVVNTSDAINQLKSCTYDTNFKPKEHKLTELLEFLRLQTTN